VSFDTLEGIVADFLRSNVRAMEMNPAWEFHANMLYNTLLEDTGELSNDNPLNDDLDDEEGLLAESDENDPHSVDWLDEDDVILRDIAGGQSKINVVLSIIGEGSVEGISCGQLWKRYIARSTALHYRRTWAKFIPNMFIKLAVCRHVLQDGEITLLLRLDRLLSTNLRQRYKVPSITKHHQD
jgi:hypothetical protein